MRFCSADKPHVFDFVISLGADVNSVSIHGKTPYEIAEHFGHSELAELLIKKMSPTKKNIRLFLDDDLDAPRRKELFQGYDVWVMDAHEAIRLIQQGNVIEVSLDHDLGPEEAGSGYDVAKFIEQKAFANEIPRLKWRIHSANPVGKKNMTAALTNADRYWNQHEEKKLQ